MSKPRLALRILKWSKTIQSYALRSVGAKPQTPQQTSKQPPHGGDQHDSALSVDWQKRSYAKYIFKTTRLSKCKLQSLVYNNDELDHDFAGKTLELKLLALLSKQTKSLLHTSCLSIIQHLVTNLGTIPLTQTWLIGTILTRVASTPRLSVYICDLVQPLSRNATACSPKCQVVPRQFRFACTSAPLLKRHRWQALHLHKANQRLPASCSTNRPTTVSCMDLMYSFMPTTLLTRFGGSVQMTRMLAAWYTPPPYHVVTQVCGNSLLPCA